MILQPHPCLTGVNTLYLSGTITTYLPFIMKYVTDLIQNRATNLNGTTINLTKYTCI